LLFGMLQIGTLRYTFAKYLETFAIGLSISVSRECLC
jgi:hypothetical protein